MRVADVMSKPAISVAESDLLSDVIPVMVRNKLSGLPVVNSEGTLVGVMSEGDLLRRIELGTSQMKEGFWTKLFTGGLEAERYRRSNGRRVRDIMTENAVTVHETDTLADAARLMHTFKVKRLPVLKDGALVGMLSRSDFVKALGRFLAPTYEDVTVSDDEIVTRIREEIAHKNWFANCNATITCANGVVTITGYAPTQDQRRAIIVAAETADGTRSVVDCIDVYDPVPTLGV